MCTAISTYGRHHLFGRTLDLERSYGEGLVVTPREVPLTFCHEGCMKSHLALMGVGMVRDGFPLYFDAVNEAGLGMAALNFSGSGVYHEAREGQGNPASFELIPFLLARYRTVEEALAYLRSANVTDEAFTPELPATPLHWLLADRERAVTVESVAEGLCLYDNPFGVLTNDPPFPYHTWRVRDCMQVGSASPENRLCPALDLEPYSRGMGGIGLPGDYSSSSRFVRAVFAASHTEHTEEGEISRFFHMMDTVATPDGCVRTREGQSVRTVYTACADTDTLTYYLTTYTCRRLRALRLYDTPFEGERFLVIPIEEGEDIRYLGG